MTDANHIGDRDELVVGDNDHADAIPKCGSCGVAWVDHIGIMGVCAEVAQLRAERDALLKQRFEVDEREENLRLKIESAWRSERDEAIRERDEARREACARTAENLSLLGSNVRLSTLRVEHAARRGWDCYKEETP